MTQPGSSIVDGIVSYHGGGNTRETHYHAGFVLTYPRWGANGPEHPAAVIYLIGAIDSSYMNRHIRVEGTYQIPTHEPRFPGAAPDYTSEMYMRISKLHLLD